MSFIQEHDKVYGTNSSYFDTYDDDDDMLNMNEKYKRYKLVRKVGQQ